MKKKTLVAHYRAVEAMLSAYDQLDFAFMWRWRWAQWRRCERAEWCPCCGGRRLAYPRMLRRQLRAFSRPRSSSLVRSHLFCSSPDSRLCLSSMRFGSWSFNLASGYHFICNSSIRVRAVCKQILFRFWGCRQFLHCAGDVVVQNEADSVLGKALIKAAKEKGLRPLTFHLTSLALTILLSFWRASAGTLSSQKRTPIHGASCIRVLLSFLVIALFLDIRQCRDRKPELGRFQFSFFLECNLSSLYKVIENPVCCGEDRFSH
jgi:hypothetical protein